MSIFQKLNCSHFTKQPKPRRQPNEGRKKLYSAMGQTHSCYINKMVNFSGDNFQTSYLSLQADLCMLFFILSLLYLYSTSTSPSPPSLPFVGTARRLRFNQSYWATMASVAIQSFPTKCEWEQVHSVGNETAHYYVILSFTVEVIVMVDTKIAVIISRGFHSIYESLKNVCLFVQRVDFDYTCIWRCSGITMWNSSSKVFKKLPKLSGRLSLLQNIQKTWSLAKC